MCNAQVVEVLPVRYYVCRFVCVCVRERARVCVHLGAQCRQKDKG